MTGSDDVFGLPQQPSPTARTLSPADAARVAAGKRSKRADNVPLPADIARGTARRSGLGDTGDGRDGDSKGPSSVAALSGLHDAEIREMRRKKGILTCVLVVLAVVSLCVTNSAPMMVSPVEVAQCYAIRAQQLWCQAFDPANAPVISEVLAEHPTYYWTLTALSRTAVYVLCGFALALSGMLYQNVFRNPIAAPSMLGVSSGMQLGVAVIVLMFGTMAGSMLVERYVASYAAVCIVLLALFALTWLMNGKGRPFNVTNLLLVGVILNSFIGVVVTFIANTFFDEELYDIFQGLSTGGVFATDFVSWAFLLVGMAIAFAPIVAMRFRMNALAFSREEARMFGVDPTRMQLLALVCGTVAMVTAQMNVGAVAMITLVVPHMARAVFGAEFRKQFAGAMLLGACVLLGCYVLATLLVVPLPNLLPFNVVVNLVLLPVFVWMIATQQRRWD